MAERCLAYSLGLYFFFFLLKSGPTHCRPWDLQWSQLLPARELQEWRLCQARSIALGCEHSWVNKWKQKENWLGRSLGKKKQPTKQNQPPILYRQQGALHPLCLLFFCWGLMSQSVKSCMPWAWSCWSRCPGEGEGGHVVTIAPPHQNSPFPRGSELSKLGKCHTRGWGGWLEGQQQGFYTNQLAHGCACLHHPERWILRGLGVFQTISSPPVSQERLCCVRAAIPPCESPLCNLLWVLHLMWTKCSCRRGEDLPPVPSHHRGRCGGWFKHEGSQKENSWSMSMCLTSKVLQEHRDNTYCNLSRPKHCSVQFGQQQTGTDFRKVMIYVRYSTTFFFFFLFLGRDRYTGL